MTTKDWAGFPMLGFDFESTDASPLDARVVTAALVEIQPNHRPTTTAYVCDPGVDIPEEAAAIHGYTRDRAQAEATHTREQLLYEITGRLALWMGRGYPVVGFNLAYDFTLLEAENQRLGIDTLASRLTTIAPVVDCQVLDKFGDPYRMRTIRDENREPILLEDGTTKKQCHRCNCGATDWRLTSACRHYGVVHTGAHDAGADALAACRLWPRIMTRYARKMPGMTLMGLHQAQVKWRREQMDGLREFLEKVGKEHDGCDPGWPILDAARGRVAA